MKVKVSGYVYLPYDQLPPTARAKLREDLTIIPRQTSEYSNGVKPIKLYDDSSPDYFGVPRGFFDRHVVGKHEYEVDVTVGAPMGSGVSPDLFKGDTDGKYAEQNAAVQAMLDRLNSSPWGGGILKAPTGTGKTIMALRIAAALGRRTLVIVNKGFFLRQWKSRIKSVFPNAKIGIVQQNRCEIDGMDFVLGMVHTIAERGVGPEFDSIGLVITDEVHRIGAPTWAPIIPSLKAAHRLGLSATLRRKDGAEDVFFNHIGDIAYALTSQPMPIRVRRLNAPFQPGPVRRYGKMVPLDEQSSNDLLDQLVNDPLYNRTIAEDVVKAISAGRKVIIVSERLEHLWSLSEQAKIISGVQGIKYSQGFAVGQQYVLDEDGNRIQVTRKVNGKNKLTWKTKATTDADLDEIETKQVIWATKQMIEEGFDIPSIDTIVLATPVSDPEQLVGRARRWCEAQPVKCASACPWRSGLCASKPTPVVVDVRTPDWQPYMRKAGRREGFYVSVGADFGGKNGKIIK